VASSTLLLLVTGRESRDCSPGEKTGGASSRSRLFSRRQEKEEEEEEKTVSTEKKGKDPPLFFSLFLLSKFTLCQCTTRLFVHRLDSMANVPSTCTGLKQLRDSYQFILFFKNNNNNKSNKRH
jgi:hypothetical protein